MVMFISTQVLAQSKDCLEMGILSDSSEKVNHCGINSQQIAVKIGQTSMHFITSWSDHHRVQSVPARSKDQGDQGDLYKRHLFLKSINVWNLRIWLFQLRRRHHSLQSTWKWRLVRPALKRWMRQRAVICWRPDLHLDSSWQITIVAEVAREEDSDEQAMVSFLKSWEAFENQSDIIEFQA